MQHEFADFFQALASVTPQVVPATTLGTATGVSVLTVDATQLIGGGENTLNLH